MATQTRFVADSEEDLRAWLRAVTVGFQDARELGEEEVRLRRAHQDLTRAQGVFEGDRCVATYRSFDQRLTAVGGATLPSNAVSGVTVLPTHRRRGLLRGLIEADLAAARERGDVVSTLIAAEHRIYGRFGFGPATRRADLRVDAHRSGLRPVRPLPEGAGTLEFADAEEVRKVGPELHERFRAGQPGAIDRSALWWEQATGAVRLPPQTWQERFFVVYRDPSGTPQGLALYALDGSWTPSVQPDGTVTVLDLVATTPAAERALWHYLLSLDWGARVTATRRAPDDLLPELLPDPRAVRWEGLSDFLWLRPLDVGRMLAARSYAAPGTLVLQVHDPLGLTGGRFLLDVPPEAAPGAGAPAAPGAPSPAHPGAELVTNSAANSANSGATPDAAPDTGVRCAPTTRSADLTLDVGALGALFLGDESAARLLARGAAREERPGAAARADLLFHTGRRPWCPDGF